MVDSGDQETARSPVPENESIESVFPSVVERVYQELGQEKQPGAFGGACGFAASVAEHLVGYQNVNQPRSGVETKVVQTLWLHEAADGKSLADVAEQVKSIHIRLEYPEVCSYAFQHAVLLVHQGDTFFLLDPTFCQFMSPEEGVVQQGSHKSSGVSIEDPLVQELYQKGYITFTAGNARRYLELTSIPSHHATIPASIDVSALFNSTLREIPEFDTQELDRYFAKDTDKPS